MSMTEEAEQALDVVQVERLATKVKGLIDLLERTRAALDEANRENAGLRGELEGLREQVEGASAARADEVDRLLSEREQYVKRIAEYVDRKMHHAADQTRGADTVRIAVLAALNIADEHFRLRDARARGSDARRLTLELEQLIDSALDGEASPPGEPEDPA